MNPARREIESHSMRATRAAARRQTRPRKRVTAAATRRAATPPVKAGAAPPQQVLFRMCKPGWGVIVEKIPNAQGTRFVCPFCPRSHRVSGPVRGFRKMRRAQWVKLRRVEE
jgi:hypothetical protein